MRMVAARLRRPGHIGPAEPARCSLLLAMAGGIPAPTTGWQGHGQAHVTEAARGTRASQCRLWLPRGAPGVRGPATPGPFPARSLTPVSASIGEQGNLARASGGTYMAVTGDCSVSGPDLGARGDAFVHPSADVSAGARVGPGTRVWHHAQIREGVVLGENCVVGKGAYIDHHVRVGSNVKIQNGASIFYACSIEDGVFIGPHVCITNDRVPRAITADGRLKTAQDWSVAPVHIREGASVGAGAIVLPGLTVGRFALIGAGAVVTRDVADFALVVGCPARPIGQVCPSGHRIGPGDAACGACGWSHDGDA